MRITQSMLLQNQARQLSAAYTRLFAVQEQLASGKKLLRPSDNPSAIRPALDLRSGQRRLEQVKKNAELASSELGTSEGVLRNASDIVSRAQEIAVAGASGSLNQADRDGLAIEVDGLIGQLVSLGNARGLTGYLFGGSHKSTAPFEQVETADGTVILYRGDDKTTAVDLGDGLSLDLNVPGSEIFGIGTRQPAIYSGTTGAAAGTGNDSARGTDRLTVTHLQTVLGDGLLGGSGDSVSGLRTGASSAADDTILGPMGTWQISLVDTSGTGSAGSISLGGGPAVAWTSADTDLGVLGPNGEVVHLDLSAVTAGFSGTVGAAGAGALSLDGGLTTSAIDFTRQNQVVTDSETGGTIFVDARNITRSGVDLLRFPGSYDLFSALVELRDALQNHEGMATDSQLARIRSTVGELSEGEDHVLAALSRLGARLRLADTTRSRSDELSLLLTQNQSSLEDVDFAAASVELSQAELVLQAGVTISARIGQLPSLVNLL